MDHLLQMGLSNACFALGLAIVALLVGRHTKRPHLAHMLWLLVFIKLVTPPIVTIPVATISLPAEIAVTADQNMPLPQPAEIRAGEKDPVSTTSSSTENHSNWSSFQFMFSSCKPWLFTVWLLGSAVVLTWSLVRVFRFNHLLVANSEIASHNLRHSATKIASRLKLKKTPTIYTTSAHISPMVWWIGGRVRVVIPKSLIEKMHSTEMRWVLAHELAHVRRLDHLVRWLEWLACVLFWWNPVVWWAQRNLRAMEEICCDALVVSSLNPKPHSYAKSILMAVESLACPVLRPPAMASEINSGGFLERRFEMIVSNKAIRSSSRRIQILVLICAIFVLPLGIASGQDYKAIGKRLKKAVRKGEVTEQQAEAMLSALKRTDDKGKAKGDKKAKPNQDNAKHNKEIYKKIEAAVKAGNITKEEAKAKLGAIKKKAEYKKTYDKKKAAKYKEQAAYEKAVEYKKVAEQKAKKSYEKAIKAKKAADSEIYRRIEAAVKAGEMTKEEARAKLGAIKEKVEKATRYKKATEYMEKAAMYKKAAEKKEKAAKYKQKAAEYKKAAEHKQAAEYRERAAKYRESAEYKERAAEYEKAGEYVKAAEFKRRAAYEEAVKNAKKAYDAEFYRKIEAAVKSGEMSKQDAKAKLDAIKKKGKSKKSDGYMKVGEYQMADYLKQIESKKAAEAKKKKAAQNDDKRAAYNEALKKAKKAYESDYLKPKRDAIRNAAEQKKLAEQKMKTAEFLKAAELLRAAEFNKSLGNMAAAKAALKAAEAAHVAAEAAQKKAKAEKAAKAKKKKRD